MKKIGFLFLFSALAITTIAVDASTFARFPALNPDGSMIAFSYQGDIWTVPADGGKASRITIHQAYESYPCWSPDGSRIVFSSNRFGQNDLFIIRSGGGLPERITFHSASDRVTNWSAADKLLFESKLQTQSKNMLLKLFPE